MAPITVDSLDDVFTYHNDPTKLPNYQAVREAAKVFAKVVLENTPASADQTHTIRLIRTAVMFANGAIALDGRY